jgi:hypothetical protein
MTPDQPGEGDFGLDSVAAPGSVTLVAAPPRMDIVESRAWLDAHRAGIRQLLDRDGAVSVTGLPIRNSEDFAVIRDVLVTERVQYREKATPRSSYGNDVFSSTDLPPTHAISPHNENSYTLTFPGVLLFCCLTAPAAGGATPIADCRKVLATLPAPLAERFRQSGWLLSRSYYDHLSLDWPVVFGTTSADEVTRYCANHMIGCDWGADGRLRTHQLRSATIRHPRTKEEVWFNHVAFWSEWSLDAEIREVMVEEFGADGLPFNTAFGDGEPLSADDVATINAAYHEVMVRRPWEPGDLLIVDNVLAAHARDPFQGDRKVLVAMGDPIRLEDCAPTVAPGVGPRG